MADKLKNALLAVLSVSLVALFGLNLVLSLGSGRFSRMRETLGIVAPTAVTLGGEDAAVTPVKLGVCGDEGLYMASGESLTDMFSAVAPILSEALGSVNHVSPVREDEFIEHLGRRGIYFSFTFPVPFGLLQYWWTGEEGFGDDRAVSVMALTVAGDATEIVFTDGEGGFYKAGTAAGYDRLSAICGGYRESNAYFACEGDLRSGLLPWEAVPAGSVYFPGYSVSVPDFTVEGAAPSELLSAFDINPFLAKVYKNTSGDIVYVEGHSALQFSRNGLVAFSSADGGIPLELPEDASGELRTAMAAVGAGRLMGRICSAASCRSLLSVAEIREKDGEYTIAFERMAGGAFITEEDGYTAVATVRDGRVTGIRLWLSALTRGGDVMMLPYSLASSVLEGEDMSLFVRYTRRGDRLDPNIYVMEGGALRGME